MKNVLFIGSRVNLYGAASCTKGSAEATYFVLIFHWDGCALDHNEILFLGKESLIIFSSACSPRSFLNIIEQMQTQQLFAQEISCFFIIFNLIDTKFAGKYIIKFNGNLMLESENT